MLPHILDHTGGSCRELRSPKRPQWRGGDPAGAAACGLPVVHARILSQLSYETRVPKLQPRSYKDGSLLGWAR